MHDTPRSLLERVRQTSDGAAWRRLVDLYTPFLQRIVQKFDVWDSDRDDLIQEVFAVVVQEIPAFKHNEQRGAFRLWLRTITVNRLRGALRSRRKQRATEVVAALNGQADPTNELEQLWEQEHDAHVVRKLMELLEPEFALSTWQAFRRLVLDGVPATQVAAELGISVNAAWIAKSRVLRRLRQEIEGLID
jgi:RNA polymerase sigma-70 factor (ECF subfamily)